MLAKKDILITYFFFFLKQIFYMIEKIQIINYNIMGITTICIKVKDCCNNIFVDIIKYYY